MILCHFQRTSPKYFLSQESSLQWLAQAHARSEGLKPGKTGPRKTDIEAKFLALFKRYGCHSDRIARRGVSLRDFTHTDWEKMELFSLGQNFHGPTIDERTEVFQAVVKDVCKTLFPSELSAPKHLIHVTCTGYVSPSCAQEAVVLNKWENRTTVTHAYHMGCYAAIPAIRMAAGFQQATFGAEKKPGPPSSRVDILHTEVCSIHCQPFEHSPEQVVVQSLFADGFIKYSLIPVKQGLQKGSSGLAIEAVREVLIPDSLKAISWECGEWGMKMGLSREVPQRILDSLEPFLVDLCKEAGLNFKKARREAIFAIHPGGPKIIDQIQTHFDLSGDQVKFSNDVLKSFGNMSSATLPHIWEEIVQCSDISEGTVVISLAFGPGISICGAVLRKVVA